MSEVETCPECSALMLDDEECPSCGWLAEDDEDGEDNEDD